jgi:putative hydrolase of the HAD superfamily
VKPATRNRAGTLLCVDADNTLWDTNAVFANAQIGLLHDVEAATGITAMVSDKLRFVREYDQALAARDHRGLRYPASLLAHAVAIGLTGIPAEAAAKLVLIRVASSPLGSAEGAAIAEVFALRLKEIPPLRDGVHEGMKCAALPSRRLIVVTEGTKSRVETLLAIHGITSVENVVESPKNEGLFRRLAKLVAPSALKVMIGDQPDRDVRPARGAGFVTIYFPSDFKPHWLPMCTDANYQITSFSEVCAIVDELESSGIGNAKKNVAVRSSDVA